MLGGGDLSGAAATMVHVGEGNQPGSSWWAVGFRDYLLGIRVYLSDAPALSDGARPTWIYELSNIAWEGEKMERAKAAFAVANSCVAGQG